MKLTLSRDRLPWRGTPARGHRLVARELAERLGEPLSRWLPLRIWFFVDLEVDSDAVERFVSELPMRLHEELRARTRRTHRWTNSGRVSCVELERFLTDRRGRQTWSIYFGVDGGLGDGPGTPKEAPTVRRGVVPCSSMPNHGVAWWEVSAGRTEVSLCTSRRQGADWDWESDIGHESAHAAFAPIPLFAQGVSNSAEVVSFADAADPRAATPAHVARLCYALSELAVVLVRGELRPSASGLPVWEEPEEVLGALSLAALVFDGAGFERSRELFESWGGRVEVGDAAASLEFGLPLLRVLPRLRLGIDKFSPPALGALLDAS